MNAALNPKRTVTELKELRELTGEKNLDGDECVQVHGISHNKLEDTKEEHLELAFIAFDKLAGKAMQWISVGRGR
jgi:hypothetical protein